MKFEVLIVDDLNDNLLALNAILERNDVTIRKATSGQQALELMMKHEFCLAILDVKMPTMSGFELAELMRGTKKTKNIPIIFVTATATEQNFSFKGYNSGAVDFLLKPLDTHAVQSKVNIFIELHRQKLELAEQLERITNLVRDLNKAKIEAEYANAAKTEFLAHMSHEIRTPIGAILGFSELMKSAENTAAENHAYAQVVERNSHQLLRLIDDILDLSKVEAGKISTETIDFSLAEMLSDLQSTMALRAQSKGIGFEFKINDLIPSRVTTDPYRLRQILNNVVGNAIKFTESGKVQLRISHDQQKLKVEVQDSGLGISKEQETRLFQPFSQADTSTTRKFGGSGLGLILSRRLAEAIGGRLELLTSTEGSGSTFLIEIPAPPAALSLMISHVTSAPVAKENAEAAKSARLNGLKVLLVEDSSDNQVLIRTYLQHEGASVTCVSDGATGVNSALDGRFNVVLMDIQMPVLDGHQATRKLRASGFETPIIALTAHAMNEESAKCRESGFTEFLTKPIERELLIKALSKFVAGNVPSYVLGH